MSWVLQEDMHLFSISVSLILTVLSTRSVANKLDGFADTCNSSTLSVGIELTSYCQRLDGSYVWSSINLDYCLVNTNGALYCSQK